MSDVYEVAKVVTFWFVFAVGAFLAGLWLIDKALTRVTLSLKVYRTILEFYCDRKAYYAWRESRKRADHG